MGGGDMTVVKNGPHAKRPVWSIIQCFLRLLSHSSEGDGVAQFFGGWDGMLPLKAGRACQDIDRTRCEEDFGCSSRRSYHSLKPHAAHPCQRDAYDRWAEHRRIPTPSDAGSLCITADEDLFDGLGRNTDQ